MSKKDYRVTRLSSGSRTTPRIKDQTTLEAEEMEME